MNLTRTRCGARRMGLAAIDADRSWTRDMVDGVEYALSRASAVAKRTPSLLTSKKCFKERASLRRLVLDLSYRRG